MLKWNMTHGAQMSPCATTLSIGSVLSFFAFFAGRFIFALRFYFRYFAKACTPSERQLAS